MGSNIGCFFSVELFSYGCRPQSFRVIQVQAHRGYVEPPAETGQDRRRKNHHSKS